MYSIGQTKPPDQAGPGVKSSVSCGHVAAWCGARGHSPEVSQRNSRYAPPRSEAKPTGVRRESGIQDYPEVTPPRGLLNRPILPANTGRYADTGQ